MSLLPNILAQGQLQEWWCTLAGRPEAPWTPLRLVPRSAPPPSPAPVTVHTVQVMAHTYSYSSAVDWTGGSWDQQTHKTPVSSHNTFLSHSPFTEGIYVSVCVCVCVWLEPLDIEVVQASKCYTLILLFARVSLAYGSFTLSATSSSSHTSYPSGQWVHLVIMPSGI